MDFDIENRLRGFSLVDLMIALVIAALLMTVAIPGYNEVVQRARVSAAIADMGDIALQLRKFRIRSNDLLPPDLATIGMDDRTDPWGNPYRYLNIQAGANRGAVRKDRNLVPINTDFDLYSMGRDGRSVSPLTAKASRDDIVRANNGAYVGLAEEY